MFFDKLQAIERRFVEIEESLAQPNLPGAEVIKLTKERAEIEEVVVLYQRYKVLLEEKEQAEGLLEDQDKEVKSLAKEELLFLEAELEKIKNDAVLLMMPKDPKDSKNVMIEVRAGTGGDEAGLFSADLLRMYTRYAEKKGWKTELMHAVESSKGGFKEVVMSIQGKNAYSRMKYEMGAHRVQRVPATESQGRIHTSACTVAVMAEVEEIEVDINPVDLKIDTYRSSGSGGQHVNTTDSAVRITHIPTGTVAECQDERSQHKNKEKALKMLRSRIYDKLQKDQESEIRSDRKKQVGSGDRSERIRTYNFGQARVTDHRINLTLYKLEDILNGDMDEILDALSAYYTAELLNQKISV